MPKSKTPSQSRISTRYVLMPEHTNPNGTAFGGVIMSWIDLTASMAAQSHSETAVVTVSMDSISFIEPINIGNHVILESCVTYSGKTSMETYIEVYKESFPNPVKTLATFAHVSFVALDPDGFPVRVPALHPENDEDRMMIFQAKERAEHRRKYRCYYK
jgi:acyl-CoA hydrolase